MKIAAIVALLLAAILFLTVVPESTEAAGCSCPQCIIYDPICAYSYSPRERRGFSSECHMHCHNRCHGTNFSKSGKGTKCY